MSLRSIDQIEVGMWLMCVQGPLRETGTRGSIFDPPSRNTARAREFEGCLGRVLAIQPPMLMLELFPLPCGDPRHDHTPFPFIVPFAEMEWSTVNDRYRKEYVKRLDLKKKPLKTRRQIVADKLAPRRLRDLFPLDPDQDLPEYIDDPIDDDEGDDD